MIFTERGQNIRNEAKGKAEKITLTPREVERGRVFVISEDFKNLNLRERLEILGLAAGRLFEPIDALGYAPEEIRDAEPVSILHEALDSGVVRDLGVRVIFTERESKYKE